MLNRTSYLLITGIVLCTILAVLISKQNTIASQGKKSFGYLAYNWSNVQDAKNILKFWKSDIYRTKAVRLIIILDYFLMLLYGSLLVYGLLHRAGHFSGSWMQTLLYIGAACIISGVIADFVQDTVAYYNLGHANFKNVQALTRIKWGLLVSGVILLVAGYIVPK